MIFGNVSLIKHMKMARFSFAIPLVRVIYFVLTCVFIVLCFIAFLVLCYGVIIINDRPFSCQIQYIL